MEELCCLPPAKFLKGPGPDPNPERPTGLSQPDFSYQTEVGLGFNFCRLIWVGPTPGSLCFLQIRAEQGLEFNISESSGPPPLCSFYITLNVMLGIYKVMIPLFSILFKVILCIFKVINPGNAGRIRSKQINLFMCFCLVLAFV